MENREEVRIAVPSKGRLREPALKLLESAGITLLNEHVRSLISPTIIPWISIIFVRAADIPRFVESGAADIGITGYDFMVEAEAKVEELLDLEFGFSRIVLAAPEGSRIKSPNDLGPDAKVATKFPRIAEKYFKSKNVKVQLVKVSGAAEIAPLVRVADAIVDLTSTGVTLKIHGLKIVDEILRSSARLITSRKALEAKKREIEEVVTAILSVLKAKGKKLIMMNVPEEKLQEVVRLIPSMGGPTIARVESKPPMWEVYSVIDEKDVYRVINSVKAAGARDIIVLPIERIIP